jgi:hypothetical protein
MAGVQFLAGARNFSGLHVTLYAVGTGALSLGVKWPEHEGYQSPPSSAKIKNSGTMSSVPHTSSWHGALLIKHSDNLTFVPLIV